MGSSRIKARVVASWKNYLFDSYASERSAVRCIVWLGLATTYPTRVNVFVRVIGVPSVVVVWS